MSIKDNIWIYSDVQSRYAELAGGALALGGKAKALVTGLETDAEACATCGACEVHAIRVDPSRMVEDYVDAMASTMSAQGAPLVLVAATRRGRLLGARLSYRLKLPLIADVSAVSFEGDAVVAQRSVYGGLAQGTEKAVPGGAVLLVAPGAFDAVENAPKASITMIEAKAEGRVTCTGHHPKQGSTVELGRARRVLGVGRGIKAQADLTMAEELAKVLDAEVGCSRPIAEAEKWIAAERYIGITGVKLKADLYLLAGISGQIQHMAGADGVRTLAVINKDKNCPAFQYADYGIVGDLYKILPALTKLLQA